MKLTKKLIEYLDGFEFYGEYEVLGAINDFYKWEHTEGTSYGELVEYWELSYEYIQKRQLNFND